MRQLIILFSVISCLFATDYNSDIQPVFNSNCISCHNGSHSTGLDLTSYDNLMAGTSDHGPIVIPFVADSSILIQKLSDNPPFGDQMPRDGLPLDQ